MNYFAREVALFRSVFQQSMEDAALRTDADERQRPEAQNPAAVNVPQSRATARQGNVDSRGQLAILDSVRADERMRIAREIHDELGQNLLALKFDMLQMHKCANASDAAMSARTEAALHSLDTTVRSMREVINNLRPPPLEGGLIPAIRTLLDRFRTKTQVAFHLHGDDPSVLADGTEAQWLAVYRILQEALSNIARHANASAVQVCLTREGQRFQMRVTDDGIGFCRDQGIPGSAVGIRGMNERTQAIGGELQIISAPMVGTTIELQIMVGVA